MYGQGCEMSVEHYCIPLESPEEWRSALKGINHTFGHTWENCYAMYLTTGLQTYLYSYRNDTVRIVCPIAEREFEHHVDIVKPFGFAGFVGTGHAADFSSHWEEFARERGYVCGYLGLNPLFDFGGLFRAKDVFDYDTIFVLDLTRSIDELLAQMHRKRRRELKQYEDPGSYLVTDKPVLQEFILEHYADFLLSRNASHYYSFTKETLSFLLGLDNTILAGARESGKLVAVAACFYTADSADGMLYVSLPEGQHCSAPLFWYTACQAKALGIPSFNFGGGGGGIADFKRRFGCRELPLKCLKQVYEPAHYETLCRTVNADPKETAGYFPAYRR